MDILSPGSEALLPAPPLLPDLATAFPLYWLLGTSVQKYAPLREKILLPLLAIRGGLVYNQTSSTASPLLE